MAGVPELEDPFSDFKAKQRESWAFFAPLETATTPPAANLVRFAGVRPGQRVLDVGTGTGVVALTAARLGAKVTGLDLTPELLSRAKENAAIAGTDDLTWKEGDAENLPFPDGQFDVVLSQFGHMFAPRADLATRELLRVLRPGGAVAFSTWPPELFVGQMFALVGKHTPSPPGVSPPPQWGDPSIVRERLAASVRDLHFERGVLAFPSLSPQHYRDVIERTAGPVIRVAQAYKSDPAKLSSFRKELEALIGRYHSENVVRQDYLMTRAVKV